MAGRYMLASDATSHPLVSILKRRLSTKFSLSLRVVHTPPLNLCQVSLEIRVFVVANSFWAFNGSLIVCNWVDVLTSFRLGFFVAV